MICEAVQSVLEALDEQGRTDFADWEERVKASLISLEAEYKTLLQTDRSPISYSDLSSQAAYVYRYVYGHAEFFTTSSNLPGKRSASHYLTIPFLLLQVLAAAPEANC